MQRIKGLKTKVFEVDGRKVFTFTITSTTLDRDNEIVDVNGGIFDDYYRNPVVLDSHRGYTGIDMIVGKVLGEIRKVGNTLEADIVFNTATEKGQRVEQMVTDGFLNAVSIGFISTKVLRGNSWSDPVTHVEWKLHEISVVAVPSNTDALIKQDTMELVMKAMKDPSFVDEIRKAFLQANDQSIDHAIDIVCKAGRSISAVNRKKLEDAIGLINDVIAPKPEETPKPDEITSSEAFNLLQTFAVG